MAFYPTDIRIKIIYCIFGSPFLLFLWNIFLFIFWILIVIIFRVINCQIIDSPRKHFCPINIQERNYIFIHGCLVRRKHPI